jgi:hypothetical protein
MNNVSWQDGFVDKGGGKYFPVMIRVGRGKRSSVSSVSLEEKVDKLLKTPPPELRDQITQLMEVCDNCGSDQTLTHTLKIYFQTETKLKAQHCNLSTRLLSLAKGMPAPLPPNWEARVMDNDPKYVSNPLCIFGESCHSLKVRLLGTGKCITWIIQRAPRR